MNANKASARKRSKQQRPADKVSPLHVEHAGQEHSDPFLQELSKHAPWEVWAAKLAGRKHPLPLHKLIRQAGCCPLVWSTDAHTNTATIQLLDELYSLRRRRRADETPADWSLVVTDWLDSLAVRPLTSELALEAIAWSHALPRLAVRVPAAVWSRLVSRLVDLAAEAISSESAGDGPGERLLMVQLLRGELPLTLAYVFPKVESCQQLSHPARATINDSLIQALDGEGIPHALAVAHWRSLLGCWIRCLYMDRTVAGEPILADARLQCEWLVRQTVRFLRPDGTLMLSDDDADTVSLSGLIKAALEIAGDDFDRELYDLATGRLKDSETQFESPHAGEHSVWAQVALLRGDWTGRAAYLAISHPHKTFHSELGIGKHRLWRGTHIPELRVDGMPLDLQGEWEELCWSSDEDMDYIELEIKLTQGWRLQRQLMLAREDDLLLAADVLLGPRSGHIEYRLELPLDPSITLDRNDETTEVQWLADRPLAWAMPLALSEWRSDGRYGKFDGRVLVQTAASSALYAPLLFDLNRKRQRKARTWRHLTVAQDLQLLQRDVAVAYRVRIGTRQWVIYRSLAAADNRTFLGHNLMSEFVVARFDTDGELEKLVEIE